MAVSRKATTTRGARPLSWVREIAFVVIGAVIVSSLLRAFVGQMFIIPSESMENTLLKGDRVVVQKLTDFHRGDVVVFEDPGGWLQTDSGPVPDPGPLDKVLELIGLPTRSSPQHLIKRVVGLPGDTVRCCDDSGRVTVNGIALDETAYLYTGSGGVQSDPSETKFTVVVPAGRIFVMGDHRDRSADSRCHLSDPSAQGQGQGAFVPVDLVVGPAFAIVSPIPRAKRLRVPDTFDTIPAPDRPPAVGVIKPRGVVCR